ncbi:MAG: adenylyl-sulfate reductase [Sedimenticola sp.]|uniref:Adenylyl-sulfate reductase n=1 Tax=Sedimenticola thiotaurini TaxID=1543721 RepID=A0A558CWM3_9GAMM|nr:adenylyl-sulfate reductase [Sedimenticola sp.]TVT53169.1 MAG: adenylyl-sulfate reductase [Sedimenticola thiotaurini]
MFMSNPFSELSASISPGIMQAYIILMILLVVGGTILDMIHKKSAQYFFENAKKAKKSATRTVDTGEKASIAIKVLAYEVLTSGEFCNTRRRLSHLLTMYGFIIFVATTAIMIFGYPTPATPTPAILPQLWHIGALMLCAGGYWFWFFIRVDVSAEGLSWYRFERADLFILSLLTTATFALLWSFTQSSGIAGWSTLFLVLFIASSTTLFGGVLWSKFAHMFFKPAAAFQKRVTRADGSRENLPAEYDLTDPAVQAKFPDIPEYMGKNPPYMGLGIKRESANHY